MTNFCASHDSFNSLKQTSNNSDFGKNGSHIDRQQQPMHSSFVRHINCNEPYHTYVADIHINIYAIIWLFPFVIQFNEIVRFYSQFLMGDIESETKWQTADERVRTTTKYYSENETNVAIQTTRKIVRT